MFKKNPASFAYGRKCALLLADALRVLQAIPGAKCVNGVAKGQTLAKLNNMNIGMQFLGGWEAPYDRL